METYELKRGAYKNLTLRIRPDGSLRVSAPWFVTRVAVDRFVSERAGWIAERRKNLPAPLPAKRDSVSVWGEVHRVRAESPGKLPRVLWDAEAREVVLRVPASWGHERLGKILDDWEKKRVAEALGPLVAAWSARMGLKVDRWTVKRLKSRWGSCQPAIRSLVFNSRLGSLPPACLEHVVVHELVHLMELSHNARFHALVEHWLPGSREIRAVLRKGTGPAGSDAFPEPPATPGAEKAP